MTQIKQPPHLLAPEIIRGFERRAELGTIPIAKLEEIIQLRAMIRALCGHIAAVEGLLAKETPIA